MVLTSSTMLTLGTSAPSFSLNDVLTKDLITLDTFKEKNGLLVMFICRHCPFVVHVQEELSKIGRDYQTKNLGLLATLLSSWVFLMIRRGMEKRTSTT